MLALIGWLSLDTHQQLTNESISESNHNSMREQSDCKKPVDF